jgi:hypothetical protein
MELIKVEAQFFAGLGFSISGEALVMGNYDRDRRLLSLTGMEGFPGKVSSALTCWFRTLTGILRSEVQHAGF